jgi:adenylate cyclase
MDVNPPADPERQSADAERMGDPELKRSRRFRRLRRLWRTIPSPPRCKMCTRPFGAPGGPIMRLVGLGPWPGNPKYCRGCFKVLYRNREGAEIECTLLFADIRGSTQLGESMSSAQFRALMDRFYETAAEVLVDHEAIVDKFVGDEVIGIFVPALTEGNHASQAINAGLDLLRATGNETDAPWAPIGIGVNTGQAYVGAVGTADHVEFTALGDAVNITARLASVAARGEILVTEAAARAGGIGIAGLERRRLDLRGRSEATHALVVTLRSVLAGTTSPEVSDA